VQSFRLISHLARILKGLNYSSNGDGVRLTIEGGDLTVGTLNLSDGEVATGQYKIIHTGGVDQQVTPFANVTGVNFTANPQE